MRVNETLMLATRIPTGLKLIDHDNPASGKELLIYEGDYLIFNSVENSIRPHFSAYGELIKRGVKV